MKRYANKGTELPTCKAQSPVYLIPMFMKYSLAIRVIVIIAVFFLTGIVNKAHAQHKTVESLPDFLFDPEYIKIGMSKAEFEDWLKSIDAYNASSWRKHHKANTEVYELATRLIAPTDHKINKYYYHFTDGKCVYMDVNAYKWDNYKAQLSKFFKFQSDETIHKTKIAHHYTSIDARYKLTVMEDINDTGFDKQRDYSIQISPSDVKNTIN